MDDRFTAGYSESGIAASCHLRTYEVKNSMPESRCSGLVALWTSQTLRILKIKSASQLRSGGAHSIERSQYGNDFGEILDKVERTGGIGFILLYAENKIAFVSGKTGNYEQTR